MTIRKISRENVVMIFLVLNFIAISATISVITWNSAVSKDQREQLIELTEVIHHSDQVTENRTETLIATHIKQDEQIHHRQMEIVNNQKTIIAELAKLIQQHQNITIQHVNMSNQYANLTSMLNQSKVNK